ncbi:MAG TPA: sulfotransferase [Gammaproteobacteria bacterium]|jgi:hypothetical protein|nr:sulfotransferase [Gammaproteobacteria bacterium]
MSEPRHPNFIVGGTAAGGTSFLSSILVQHPQIYLPKEMRPEPHYFYKSWEYAKGQSYYLERWFQNVPATAIAIGERSSSYLFGGEAVARKIAAAYPDMKFIFTLRNPIERTWANYRYTVLQGLESLSFEEALRNEPVRIREQTGIWAEIQPHNYTGRGFYAAQIYSYLKYFPKNNLLFIKSELLSTQTDVELRKIYKFLGLSLLDFDYVRAPDHTSVNVIDPKIQMELRQYFGGRFDKVIEAVRREEGVEKFVNSAEDNQKIQSLSRNMTGKKEPMPVDARAYLNNLFSSDLTDLKQLVDFDIADWK